jgi:hypothetical protein
VSGSPAVRGRSKKDSYQSTADGYQFIAALFRSKIARDRSIAACDESITARDRSKKYGYRFIFVRDESTVARDRSIASSYQLIAVLFRFLASGDASFSRELLVFSDGYRSTTNGEGPPIARSEPSIRGATIGPAAPREIAALIRFGADGGRPRTRGALPAALM